MESFTKTKLSGDQQAALVAAAFGPEISIVRVAELTGGMFNMAYELALSDGRAVILKVAPSEETETLKYEKNIMHTEVEALRLMRAAGTVPVPEVYSYDHSLTLISCPYFFMEKVAGQPYNEIKENLSPQVRESIEEEIGRCNRSINEVKGTHFGYFADAAAGGESNWRITFGAMLQDLLEDGRRLGAKLPADYEEIERQVAERLSVLDEVTEVRLVHWDLWNGNVLVKNGRIESIIDWERALWGDVLMEYYFRHFENSPAFFKGYGVSFDSPKEQLRIKLYDLYLDLILVIECYSRQYESQEHQNWAHDNLDRGWKAFLEI